MLQPAKAMSASAPISKLAYAPDAGIGTEIMVRLIKGMTAHFRLRASAWIMGFMTLGFGLTLLINYRAFEGATDPYRYIYLERFASQAVIGWYCVGIGVLRIVALI